MNEQEHLLTIVAEECCEIAQRATKALRFGIDEVQPGQNLPNAERIMVEFDDLLAAIYMLQARALLPNSVNRRIHDKQQKIEKYFAYSREQGTLT